MLCSCVPPNQQLPAVRAVGFSPDFGTGYPSMSKRTELLLHRMVRIQ